MQFMVDFENVRDRGLNGAQYLTPDDTVTLFFSRSSQKIGKGLLQNMIDSGCKLRICKLEYTGKNAIDYYIACRIGETFGNGYDGFISIISNDKGFKSVLDYWRNCAFTRKNVILKSDIANAIVGSNENSLRRLEIQELIKEVDIITEHKRNQEKLRMREELEKLFSDGDAVLVPQIIDIIEGERLLKKIYLTSLTRFGRKKGLEIYHKLKQIV